MFEFIIPPNAGPYRIVTSKAGTPLVMNTQSGKNKVRIACKTKKQAEEVCLRLNENDHNGTVNA